MSDRPAWIRALAGWLGRPRRAWALVPLALLAVDFVVFPYVFHTVKTAEIPPRAALIKGERPTIGRLKGHLLSVSADDVRTLEYFLHLKGERVGLVFSHYLGPDGVSSRTSPLGRALLKRSREWADELKALLKKTPGNPPGSALRMELAGADPVLTILYLVLLPETDEPDTKLRAVEAALAGSVNAARSDGLDHLIVPGLATDPRAPGHLKPSQLLDALAAALPQGGQPGTVHLQFYRGAPSDELVTSLATTREHLDQLLEGSFAGRLAGVQRRPLLLLTALSLLVASCFTLLTARNALIVGIAYVVVAGGAAAAFQNFFAGYSGTLLVAGSLVIQCVLAVGLTWIIHWDPKEVLKSRGRT